MLKQKKQFVHFIGSSSFNLLKPKMLTFWGVDNLGETRSVTTLNLLLCFGNFGTSIMVIKKVEFMLEAIEGGYGTLN